MNEIEKEIRKKIATEFKSVTSSNGILNAGTVLSLILGEIRPPQKTNTDHEQEIRDLIHTRESAGKPIWEIAEKIEKLLRDVIALQIEAEIDADVWAPAYQKAANIARGQK